MTESNNRREVILMGLATTAGAIAPRVASSAENDLPLRDSGPLRAVLVVGSNARVLQLQNNRTVATGNYLNETVVPMQALRAAGYGLIVATPDGTKPALDARSISAAHFGGDEAALAHALEFFHHDNCLQNVMTLRSVIDAGLDSIAGVFVPGGHAPITDLVANQELGEILRHAHDHGKPTALLCHGPIALLAAMPNARAFQQAMIAGEQIWAAIAERDWPYRDYGMTIFSNSEEKPVEENVFDARLQYSVADALVLAGGRVEHAAIDYAPFVVADRELITGQNPRSDHQLAARLVEALNAQSAIIPPSHLNRLSL
jgi:putative intracellular protease/amidase